MVLFTPAESDTLTGGGKQEQNWLEVTYVVNMLLMTSQRALMSLLAEWRHLVVEDLA